MYGRRGGDSHSCMHLSRRSSSLYESAAHFHADFWGESAAEPCYISRTCRLIWIFYCIPFHAFLMADIRILRRPKHKSMLCFEANVWLFETQTKWDLKTSGVFFLTVIFTQWSFGLEQRNFTSSHFFFVSGSKAAASVLWGMSPPVLPVWRLRVLPVLFSKPILALSNLTDGFCEI